MAARARLVRGAAAGAQGRAGTNGGAGTTEARGPESAARRRGREAPTAARGRGRTGVREGGDGGLGTVTLQLVVPTFVVLRPNGDVWGARSHITISTADGKDVPMIRPGCGVFCGANGTCDQQGCTPGPCAVSQGFAYTGETSNWDGTSVGTSICGAGVVCTTFPHVADGNYVAAHVRDAEHAEHVRRRFPRPARRGDRSGSRRHPLHHAERDAGRRVPPGSSPCPAALPADGARCSTPNLICDYPGVDPAGACRPQATCELREPAINWSVTQPASTCGTHPRPARPLSRRSPWAAPVPLGRRSDRTTTPRPLPAASVASVMGAPARPCGPAALGTRARVRAVQHARRSPGALAAFPTRFAFTVAADGLRWQRHNAKPVIGRNVASLAPVHCRPARPNNDGIARRARTRSIASWPWSLPLARNRIHAIDGPA